MFNKRSDMQFININYPIILILAVTKISDCFLLEGSMVCTSFNFYTFFNQHTCRRLKAVCFCSLIFCRHIKTPNNI